MDILWGIEGGKLAGAQRKTIPDLIASVQDPDKRVGRELQQMQQLVAGFWIIEGTPQWDREGNLMDQHRRWSLKQHMGVELSIQRHGFMVVHTRNPLETVATCEYLATWTETKLEEHVTSLLYRPATKNGWGRLDDRATAIHVLSGLPQIGMEFAERIFDHYKRVPCRHDLAENPPTAIHGVGPKRARAILKILGGVDNKVNS